MIEMRGTTALAGGLLSGLGVGSGALASADWLPALNPAGLALLSHAEAALRASEAVLQDLLDHASDLILSVDATGRFLSVNRAWCATLGYSAEEAVTLTLSEVTAPEERARCRDSFARLLAGEASGPVETVFLTRDGWPIAVAGNVSCRREPGCPAVLRGIFRDVTAQRTVERQLAYAATHDPLTELPNQALLTERLGQSLGHAARHGTRVALLLLDLDGFRRLNDHLGHASGDRLLMKIAERLRRAVRPADTVARLGGDEFAVLLAADATVAGTTRIAERLLATVAAPVLLDGETARITTSVGVALSAPDCAEANALLAAAAAALQRAKGAGRGHCVVVGGVRTAA